MPIPMPTPATALAVHIVLRPLARIAGISMGGPIGRSPTGL